MTWSHSPACTRPPVALMTFWTMSACFLNASSFARPPRSSITFNMSTNLRSFSAPSAWPNTAALANFILASVGITISA